MFQEHNSSCESLVVMEEFVCLYFVPVVENVSFVTIKCAPQFEAPLHACLSFPGEPDRPWLGSENQVSCQMVGKLGKVTFSQFFFLE